MHSGQIYENASYLSIHDVPYRVISRTEETVKAKCERGHVATAFEMPADRFAKAMAREIVR